MIAHDVAANTIFFAIHNTHNTQKYNEYPLTQIHMTQLYC